jgi:phage terminase large subunit
MYEWNEDRKEFSREPRHDWASHPGDAFSYGAQVMRERKPEVPKPTRHQRHCALVEKMLKPLTYDEAIKLADRREMRRHRI